MIQEVSRPYIKNNKALWEVTKFLKVATESMFSRLQNFTIQTFANISNNNIRLLIYSKTDLIYMTFRY